VKLRGLILFPDNPIVFICSYPKRGFELIIIPKDKRMEEEEKEKEDKKKLSIRDGDIILGIIFLLFFSWTALESIRMSRERIDKGMATVYTAPGLMPLIISVMILVCAIYVVVYAFMHGGRLRFREYFSIFKNSLSEEKTRATLLEFFLFFVFIFLLVGHIPFIPATIIYVLICLFVFKAGKPVPMILIGVAYSIGIVYFFSVVVGTVFPVGLFWW